MVGALGSRAAPASVLDVFRLPLGGMLLLYEGCGYCNHVLDGSLCEPTDSGAEGRERGARAVMDLMCPKQ